MKQQGKALEAERDRQIAAADGNKAQLAVGDKTLSMVITGRGSATALTLVKSSSFVTFPTGESPTACMLGCRPGKVVS